MLFSLSPKLLYFHRLLQSFIFVPLYIIRLLKGALQSFSLPLILHNFIIICVCVVLFMCLMLRVLKFLHQWVYWVHWIWKILAIGSSNSFVCFLLTLLLSISASNCIHVIMFQVVSQSSLILLFFHSFYPNSFWIVSSIISLKLLCFFPEVTHLI